MQYTENLNLAKYDANDVTSYLEVSNANLTKIDAGHGALNTQVSANTTAIGNLQDDVNDMAPQITNASTKASAGLSNTASVYDATQTYAVGDYTLYNNNLYRCNTPIPQAESFDGTKWTRVKLTDEIKTCNEEISQIITGIGKNTLNSNYHTVQVGETYTAPKDGYVLVGSGLQAGSYSKVLINGILPIDVVSFTSVEKPPRTPVFVKKGMTVNHESSNLGLCYFFELI